MVRIFGSWFRISGWGDDSGVRDQGSQIEQSRSSMITFRWGAPAAARLDKVCWLRMDVNVSPSVEVAGGFTSDWR